MTPCPRCATPNPDGSLFCTSCGAKLPAADLGTELAAPAPSLLAAGLLQPGTLLDGKYRIERILGEGGMGVVHLARDVHTDTYVVVKGIRAELAHDPELRDRILDEARALAHIDHPNVVRLNAVVADRGSLWLVMQFIEGEPLDAFIRRHAERGVPVPLDEALRLFRMILAGVAAAHHEGVIHRDLKPANVLLRAKDGVAKVGDFGIAKGEEDARAGRGRTRGIIGSLGYMAPEQLTGRRDLDKRVDVYALGVVLFELVTGRAPFDATNDYELMRMHAEAPLPSARSVRPDLPPWIDDVLAHACAKSREERYPSCEAFLADLDRQTLAPAPVVATVPLEPALAAPRGRKRWAFAALGVALLGAGVGAYVWSQSSEAPAERPVADAGAPVDAAAAGASRDAARGRASSLDALVGPWRSDSGRDYDAVRSGDVLELRIRDARQFPRQAYENGEARFTLSALPGEPRVYAVEDKIRPEPPSGVEYGPRARATCQEVWSSVGGRPLRAQFDGKRLTVDLAKIEPSILSFDIDGKTVVGCVRLSESRAAKIESVLTRN